MQPVYFNVNEEKHEKDNQVITAPYPWRRYFARSMDLFIYSIMWIAVSHLILRWNPESNFISNLTSSIISLALMFLFEPLLLSTLGTTVGKYIFGLQIKNRDNSKLTFNQAFIRTWKVFSIGMGFSIPIYNLYRNYKSYIVCVENYPLEWDEEFNYTIKDKKSISIVAYIVFFIMLFLLNIFILFQATMPINRGELTAKEYYENCNDIIKYSNFNYGKYINEKGQWIDNNSVSDNNIYLFSTVFPEHKLTLSNGIVKKVQLEFETDKDEMLRGFTEQKYIAVMSFLGAQKEINIISLYKSNLLNTIKNEFDNYSIDIAGIRVTNEVEYSGYEVFSDNMLFPIEGEEQSFHMVFTMEKVN